MDRTTLTASFHKRIDTLEAIETRGCTLKRLPP